MQRLLPSGVGVGSFIGGRRMRTHGYWLGCILAAGMLVSGSAAAKTRPHRHAHTPTHSSSPAGRSLESAILAEINFARTQPAAYARRMREGGRSNGSDRYTDRGDYGYGPRDYAERSGSYGGSARDEAIDFLANQRPLPALDDSHGLSAAAAGLAAEQAQSGRVGHTSALRERAETHGVWSGMVGEAISYGMTTPQAVVSQLIIDDGVPDRGHRALLFDRTLSVAGVGCGPHRAYGYMCVIDFAGAVVRR